MMFLHSLLPGKLSFFGDSHRDCLVPLKACALVEVHCGQKQKLCVYVVQGSCGANGGGDGAESGRRGHCGGG